MTTTLSSPSVAAPARTSSTFAAPAPAVIRSRGRWLSLPWLIGICAIAVFGAVIWAGARWTRSSTVSSDATAAVVEPRTFNVVLKEKGELKAAKSTDIKCEVEGRSTIINLIKEGTSVQEGDLLVVLASDEIETKIRAEELKETNAITAYEAAKSELEIQLDKNASDVRKAKLQIELRQLEFDKYQKGEWEQALKDAQVAIDQAVISLERRHQDYLASTELFAKKYTTQTEYEEAEFNFKKAEWELDKANMALEVLKTYTHVAELKQRDSDLEEAKKEADRVGKNADAEEAKKRNDVDGKQKELALIQEQLAKFRVQKEKCRIVAPTQGFVVYYSGGGGRWNMNNEGQIKEGAEVIERQVLMQLPDTSSMMVSVRIHEAKTDKLRLDQPVTITVEGIPGRTFTGRVQKIAALADSQSSWLNPDLKEYETEILLDPTDAPLKPGVTAHAEILVQTVEDRLAVPVQAIYAKGGKRYVFQKSGGGGAQPVPVEVGAIGSEWAEIASGVDNGARVLLAFGDELRRMIPDTGGDERSGAPGPRRSGAPRGQRGGPQRQTSATPAVPDAKSTEKPAESADAKASSPTAEATVAQPKKPEGKDRTGKRDSAGGAGAGKAP